MDSTIFLKQAEELAKDETWFVPLLSNLSALLYESLDTINWAGFYLMRNGALVLGPFQGKVACIRIAPGKGVCGTAAKEDRTVLVKDVHQFPGHIACDSASNSEIVVPIHGADGEVIGVLDIDSPVKARFGAEEQEVLESLVRLIERTPVCWEGLPGERECAEERAADAEAAEEWKAEAGAAEAVSTEAEAVSAEAKIGAAFQLRDIRPQEAEQAVLIEQICFPPNEACPPHTMRERVQAAPETFLVAVDRKYGNIAGFLNGIATDEERFRDEFFTDSTLHTRDGRNIMLCGLDVLPAYRRRGLATLLVSEFAKRESARGRERLVLTCLEEKVPMYLRMGFSDLGMSDSSWGGEAWHEMEMRL